MSYSHQDHYQRLASSYDDSWNYSPEYIRQFASQIVGRLSLTASSRTADVGCGTGLYTSAVCDLVEPRNPILCVDPSPAMLEQVPRRDGLVPLLGSAEEVAAGEILPSAALPLDSVFIKEAIHHVAPESQGQTIRGLATFLKEGGRLLIIMLPATIDYPLFEAAHRRFEELQPDPRLIRDHMREANLSADIDIVEFPIDLEKSRYLRMVENRYMSLLSTFNDAELAAGIEEIDSRYRSDHLQFSDRFAFVYGKKDPAP